MEREAVVSSNIEEIGYDPEEQTLEVQFKNGGVYQYYGVPAELHRELVNAPSIGRLLGQKIKGVFRCERIDE